MFSNKFIAASKEFCTHEKMIPAPLFRKSFSIERLPQKAELSICGLGFYKLYLNGKEITKGQFAPFQSNPDQLLYYDQYDLSELLQKGENVIGVMLGNGFLNCIGGQVWEFDKADYRSAPKFALSLETKNGCILEADESFKTHSSPILFDDFREGEHYDARLEIDGWTDVGFDDSGWQNAIPAAAPLGKAMVSGAPTLEIMQTLSPVSIHKYENGYVYDFGENTSGFCRFSLQNGVEGQLIDFLYFERLKDDNGPYIDNIRFLNGRTREGFCQQLKYICKDGEQTYQPSFTWLGYRYVYIQGLTEEQAKSLDIQACEVRSSVQFRGNFSCSDERVNKLMEIIRRSNVTNLFHYPVDCPHREKNGWTADAALSCEQMLLQMNVEDIYAEWLKNIRASQNEQGALPGIVPTGGWGFDWGNGPAWDCVLFLLPYLTYQYRGDVQILKDNAGAMARYIEYLKTKKNEDGLLAFGLGDWCQSFIWDCGSFETPLEITDSLVAYDLCLKAARIFYLLGDTMSASNAKKLGEELLAAFRKKWVNNDGYSIKSKTQTAQVLAIKCDVFITEKKPLALQELIRRIERDNNHFNVGVVGGYALFDTLAENGYVERAYYLIMQKSAPSYGYVVDLGETTLWEIMYDFGDSKSKVAYKDDNRILSMNHHFWGFVYSYFVRYVAGLQINPNFTDVRYAEIKPYFLSELTWAEASYETPTGELFVRWKKTDGNVRVEVTVPKDMRVKLIIGGTQEFLGEGKYNKVYGAVAVN
ncbi:MAG: family 78 glycoside hydrolase catalytic domain [Clostridia bacterium]|nr:family 78 glycoside hydrolase catalytic domain [Clostridia bacterium]